MTNHGRDLHDEGLEFDLRTLTKGRLDRRQILKLLAGASLVPLFGCSSSGSSDGSAGTDGGDPTGTGGGTGTGDGATTVSGTCSKIPEETAGPYPGDGTNGPNALSESDVLRSDIRTSFDTMTGTAAGMPLTVKLTLVNTNANCAPLTGYALYLWHCDQDGNYSLYTAPNENYLRGVQATDANGTVTFTSIFPGCYSGRWPHIHFETFPSIDKALAAGSKVSVSQLALPESSCKEVYATAGYEKSVVNLAQISLASDNVFSDGATLQVATVTGNVTDGYVASLTVGIAV